MERKAVMLAVAWLALGIHVFAQNPAGNAMPEKDHASAGAASAIPDRVLMQKIMNAWASMDPTAAARYYDRSPENVFFDDDGGVRFVGWQAYEKGIRKANEALQGVKYTVNNDAIVHRAGTYAWGTATVHSKYTFRSGRRQEMQERWTLVWKKKGTDWLVVHEHFSTPAPNMQ